MMGFSIGVLVEIRVATIAEVRAVFQGEGEWGPCQQYDSTTTATA